MVHRIAAIALLTALTQPVVHADEGHPQAFACCDEPRLTRVVSSYLRLQESLANPDPKAPPAGYLYAMSPLLRDSSGLPGAERTLFRALKDLVDGAKNRDTDGAREAFDAISRRVIALALRHEGGTLEVAEAFCPDLGPWLQSDTQTLRSPYGAACARWR